MKHVVHRNVDTKRLRKLIPRRYHSLLTWSALVGPEAVLIVFPNERREVLAAAVIQKTLNSISNLNEPVKVAVGSFTHEAAELLQLAGFQIPSKAKAIVPDEEPVPPFPHPVHYSGADSSNWTIENWKAANGILSCLDPTRRPFAIFSLPDESYIQCLGSKKRLLIEAREYRADGSFTHWIIGRGRPQREPVVIEVSTGTITVDVSQVLTMRHARVIIRQFLETRTFPSAYHLQDITGRFTKDC